VLYILHVAVGAVVTSRALEAAAIVEETFGDMRGRAHFLLDAVGWCVGGGHWIGDRAMVVDAISGEAAGLYRQIGFCDLGGRYLWRRLGGVACALGL